MGEEAVSRYEREKGVNNPEIITGNTNRLRLSQTHSSIKEDTD